jgi:hypothetical protein
LIETLGAMVIITLTFSFGTIIYLTMFSAPASGLYVQCSSIFDSIATEAVSKQLFIDDEIHNGNKVVKTTFRRRNDSRNAVELHMTAVDAEGKLICNMRKMLIVKE